MLPLLAALAIIYFSFKPIGNILESWETRQCVDRIRETSFTKCTYQCSPGIGISKLEDDSEINVPKINSVCLQACEEQSKEEVMKVCYRLDKKG